jgi:demethylspheroidene O-methyltransferase
VSLAERYAQWRARLVASPRFQRLAPRLFFTRGVARRRARALFDLVAGFVYSQILAACVQLKIFELLADGARESAAIAAEVDLAPETTRRLLKAAAAIKLLRAWPGDRFGLDDLGAAVLGNPGLAAMIAHHALLYQDLADPVALLRRGGGERLSSFWTYATEGDAEAYCELMSQSQALVAEDVLDAYDFAGRRRLLDVGGGEGAFASAVARRYPRLELALFDLPPVAARARAALARATSSRIEVYDGDFHSDPLPRGFDAISLIRVLHDHEDAPARLLLARAYEALPSGGALLIAEPMSEVAGAEPVGDAYFGFYLLAMGRGRPRARGEIAAMLRDAGFVAVRMLTTPRPSVATAVLAMRP